VVRDEAVRHDAVEKVRQAALALEGASVEGVIESPIHGPKGNVEFLLGLKKAALI